MAASISRDAFESLAGRYGWQYDPRAGTVTIDGTVRPIIWTKRGDIPPRSPLWRAMRSTPAFARDFPFTAVRKQAGAASSKPVASAMGPATLIQSPDFWAGLSPAASSRRQAMEAGETP